MRPRLVVAALIFLAATGAVPPLEATAAAEPLGPVGPSGRTEAPFFRVTPQSGGADRLPLKSSEASVDIAGVVARVKLKQSYGNGSANPISATYVFPLGTRAAVFAMKMTIGSRTVVAKIERKAEARRLFESAKARGQTASLLEQHRPNVFEMGVANINPGDEIQVELEYVEMLSAEAGIYAFVLPTVVGPRFRGEGQGTGDWVPSPRTASGVAPLYKWRLRARIDAGMPLRAVRSRSHDVTVQYEGENVAVLELDDAAAGNRDFILQYKLRGAALNTGLMLFPGAEENFFLMLMQPPRAVAPEQMPPREYVLVLDVSGSMRGFPLKVGQDLMRALLAGFRPQDRFNIVLFSGANQAFSEASVMASPGNIERALRFMERARGGGGTRLVQALDSVLKMPRAEGTSTSIIVATDGFISVEQRTFDLIRQSLGRANLFSFGIGRSVNRHLIEGMARAGMGEPFVVLDADDAQQKAEKFMRYIGAPVLTNVGVRFDGLAAYDVEPRAVPDVFAERPVMVFGKYRGRAEGQIHVTGMRSGAGFSRQIDVASYEEAEGNEAIRLLWARHRIQRLSDDRRFVGNGADDAITKLGLAYNLLTDLTSFVAIDSAIRNRDGSSKTVAQPVPLPQGVPNSAMVAYGLGAGKSGARRARQIRAPAAKSYPRLNPPSPRSRATNGGANGGANGLGAIASMDRVEASAAPAEPDATAEMKASTIDRRLAEIGHLVGEPERQALEQILRQWLVSAAYEGKLEIELHLAASGRVERVEIKSAPALEPTRRRVLMGHLRRAFVSQRGRRIIRFTVER